MEPEELLLAALVRLAIRDATQERNQRLQEEAIRWLWTVASVVVERAGVVRSGINFMQERLIGAE